MKNGLVRLGVECLERRDTPAFMHAVGDIWDFVTTDPRAAAATFYEGYSEGAVNIVTGAANAVVETAKVGLDVVTIVATDKGQFSTRKVLTAINSLPVAMATTSDHEIDPTQMRSSLFRGASDTAGNQIAAAKLDNNLLYGIVTMGVGPLVDAGSKAVKTGDSAEFSQAAGGFGVMVVAPYGVGRGLTYVRAATAEAGGAV